MTFDTPYLFYIISAYGFTVFSLILFLGWSYMEWKRSMADET